MPFGLKFAFAKVRRICALAALFGLLGCSDCAFTSPAVLAAEDLKLRAGVSFTQDIDAGFPIVGKDLDDCKLPSATPVLIFFGASGDLNTNRQAKRFVDIYHKFSDRELKFIVIDVDHAVNDDAKTLVKTYYRGYIPSEVLLDKNGKVAWNHDGECEMSVIKGQLDKVLGN